MTRVVLIFLCMCVFYEFAGCYKILGLFPHPASSHVNVFLPIMEGLAERGHQVTVLSHYSIKKNLKNYREIVLDASDSNLVSSVDLKWLTGYRFEKYLCYIVLLYLAHNTCHTTLASKPVQDLINSKNETFDLIIMELFNTDCYLPFAHKFQAPIIGLSSCSMMSYHYPRFANPDHPAYIPQTNLDFSDRMTFLERVENSINLLYNHFLFNIVGRIKDNWMIRQYFGENTPTIDELIRDKLSIILVNVHFSLNLPRPQVPGVIDIGGVHIKEVNKLPQELEKWINESSHGVIYFSFGSMIKGHTFPEEKRLAFLKAFERLPQRILWKWEDDTMPNQPANIRLIKWAPQLDILCHPNVVGFISHGGLLGTTEAVHCGVPVVVMPQFGDQHINARALEANGGGVILPLKEANEDNIYNAFQTILDPKFRKGAQELSERFKDRPLPPLETAIYWVEYVARHRGAHHMRTAAVDMPFYQYYLLDVLLFLTIVTLSILTIMFHLTRTIIRKLFIKDNSKIKTN